MASFDCQICGISMAIARIRTPDEPLSAAWNHEGANYTGFLGKEPFTGESEGALDQECEDCTTADRNPQFLASLPQCPCWPDSDDEDDDEWRPDETSSDTDGSSEDGSTWNDEGTDRESLGSFPPSDAQHSEAKSLDASQDDGFDDTLLQYPLRELCAPSPPERLPHGTWHDGFAYYTGNRGRVQRNYLPNEWSRPPLEHIAAPSCRSFQGVSGHVLSVEQMKNCRNVRFLVPKGSNWKQDSVDWLLEENSLFCLSGESNGSNLAVHHHFQPWHSFYPERHGIGQLRFSWEFANDGCHGHDCLRPLPVHSYCLDIFAKASYARWQSVDLDAIWHWREIECNPIEFQMDGKLQERQRRPEIARARVLWDDPWRHFPGDEWFVANPVEIPGFALAVQTCKEPIWRRPGVYSDGTVLSLPVEIIDQILALLAPEALNNVAQTCRALYSHSQVAFKATVLREMPWLWEISGDMATYPSSPDRHPTWDPLCPGGLPPFSLPHDLQSEEAEAALWEKILEENPEMEDAARAAKSYSRQRRDALREPHLAKEHGLVQEWESFRHNVEAWIKTPQDLGATSAIENMNWKRMWWLANPSTTPFPGLRNRARIWHECHEILDLVSLAHDLGSMQEALEELHGKLADSSHPGWSSNPQGEDDWY